MIARQLHGSIAPLAMPLAVLSLLVLSLLPVRLTGWVGWFAGPLQAALAPVSHLAHELTTPRAPAAVEPAESAAYWKDLYLQASGRALRAEAQARQLADQAAWLARVRDIIPDRRIVPVIASVTSGGTSTLIRVRVGSGVRPGDVVTLQNQQLVGRVVAVAGPIADVAPITTRSFDDLFGPIDAAVILDPAAEQTATALLTPATDGALAGDLGAENADLVRPGMLVRLDDPDGRWPAHARLIAILGVVARVEPAERQPLRQRVTVRPGIDPAQPLDLTRQRRVVVWTIPDTTPDTPGDAR